MYYYGNNGYYPTGGYASPCCADLTYKKTGEVPTDEELKEAAIKVDYFGGDLSEKRLSNLRSTCNNYWSMGFW